MKYLSQFDITADSTGMSFDECIEAKVMPKIRSVFASEVCHAAGVEAISLDACSDAEDYKYFYNIRIINFSNSLFLFWRSISVLPR